MKRSDLFVFPINPWRNTCSMLHAHRKRNVYSRIHISDVCILICQINFVRAKILVFVILFRIHMKIFSQQQPGKHDMSAYCWVISKDNHVWVGKTNKD